VAGTNCPPGTTIPHTCPVGCAIVFPQFAETCRAHIAATSSLDSAQFAAFETTCLQQDALALVEYALDMRAQGCIIDLTGGSRRRRTQGTQYLAQWLTSDAHGCDWDEVDDYAADVDAICCGASGSLCPGGVPPNTCSPGCAVAFHQFTTSCAPTLDVIMPVGDARRAQINAFEAACLGSADTSFFLHAIMNASCPAGTGVVATTPEPEPEPEPLPAPRCPAGATAAPGARYCSDLVGQCVGPGGSVDYVNGKYKNGVASRPDCQASCDANPACVGYAYYASGRFCRVFGPGLDTDLGGGWTADPDPATTIGGASGLSGLVCAAVAGRN
jgi:hypothetical protein